MSTPPPILEVQQLTTVFGRDEGNFRAVDEASFVLPAGQTLGLVGESGSGKSMTASSILRLVPAPGRIVGGRVLFEGRDLLTLDEREMQAVRGRRIGMVFQDAGAALNPVFSIGDQLGETLRVHGVRGRAEVSRRVAELLDAVRIPDAARRVRDYPHQLSGGLRQRAMIALALAGRPTLLIADEPTTALDVTVQAQILDLLRDLRRQLSLSLLLITHDLGVLASMADRVAVMQAGRVVEQADIHDLFRNPSHPYTRDLLASVSRARRIPDQAGAGPAVEAH